MASEKIVELNMGPQHPSTHGVLRLMLKIKGDTIMDSTAHIGYLHRCIEKLHEKRHYMWCIPLTNRVGVVPNVMVPLHPSCWLKAVTTCNAFFHEASLCICEGSRCAQWNPLLYLLLF